LGIRGFPERRFTARLNKLIQRALALSGETQSRPQLVPDAGGGFSIRAVHYQEKSWQVSGLHGR
jgi:hypothetical protein